MTKVEPGQQYNRWTTQHKHKEGSRYGWMCACQCGTVKFVPTSDLTAGKSKSCGCLRVEVSSTIHKTHGMADSAEYRAYARMLTRCFNKNSKDYKDYGERGITVCQEFVDEFMAFYNEMGPKPDDGQRWSVGRIDNTKSYEVGNVRWELDEQQARNHSLQRNNTSGHAGICLRYTEEDGDRVIARYNSLDGKRVSKSYSIGKLGLEEAMRLAVEWREARIAELNALGAGYAESHGAPK